LCPRKAWAGSSSPCEASVNSIPLGGGEEYFHVGTKSLQFGNADGDARPKKNLRVAYRPRSICGAYRKFTDTHIENGHFLCVYARAGEEITILHSIYADRKPSHWKPSRAKEKTLQTILRVYAYTNGAKEITALRSIYADMKPLHRKPSRAKEKTSLTVLRVYAYTLRSQRNHSLRVQYSCGVVLVFWFWREIVFCVT
jgi:hypothetical protein